MERVETPILFLIFNRPDLAQITFEAIARAKPRKLLVVADGPRSNRVGEAEKCIATRKILEQVNWDCEVLTHFSDTNIGCKKRVSSGISWALEQVEEVIILEDDCIPDPSFFRFCDELLEKYRHNDRVMAIGGSNVVDDKHSGDSSYYFSSTPLVWGWATWRRAWKRYDLSMTAWPEFRRSGRFREVLNSPLFRLQWQRRFEKAYRGAVDTWDYQWTLSVWVNQGMVALPCCNLITNIGFGPGATHTRTVNSSANLPRAEITFPLRHPPEIRIDTRADRIYFSKQLNIRSLLTALAQKIGLA